MQLTYAADSWLCYMGQENCYFFCSLIQEHLGADGDGRFVEGTLPHPNLAIERRRLVTEQVRLLYRTPKPFSVSFLFCFQRIRLSCNTFSYQRS